MYTSIKTNICMSKCNLLYENILGIKSKAKMEALRWSSHSVHTLYYYLHLPVRDWRVNTEGRACRGAYL